LPAVSISSPKQRHAVVEEGYQEVVTRVDVVDLELWEVEEEVQAA
jgi:hypothetical protein